MVQKLSLQAALFVLLVFGFVVQAQAALDAGIATQLTAIQVDGLALATLVWPVVIVLFGSLVMFKLFKRFGSKI